VKLVGPKSSVSILSEPEKPQPQRKRRLEEEKGKKGGLVGE